MRIEQFGHIAGVAIAEPSAADARVLSDAANDLWPELRELDHGAAFDRMAEAGAQLRDSMPELSEKLGDLATHGAEKALVLQGPVPDDGEIGPTPTDYLSPEDNPLLRVAVARGLVLGAMGVHAYGYDSQQPFNVINNVIAIQRYGGVKGASANAKSELGLHTEDASYNLSGAVMPAGALLGKTASINPDWLTLQFLRNPASVPTTVSAPNLDILSQSSRYLLEQPYFHNATNPGQQESGDNNSDVAISILHDDGTPLQRLRANTDGLSVKPGAPAEAHLALAEFKRLLERSVVDLPSQPGNIVFIDNLRTLHGRRPYKRGQEPKFDGRDRWQQRVVAVDDPKRIEAFLRAKRIVSPGKFLDHVAELTLAAS